MAGELLTIGQVAERSGVAASALRYYEARRARRVAAIVQRSRRLGRVAQLENPFLCGLRDVLLKKTPDRMLLRQAEEIVSYEV